MSSSLSISDDIILSWPSTYSNISAHKESSVAFVKSLTAIAGTSLGAERLQAIYDCMNTFIKHAQQLSKSKSLLHNFKNRLVYLQNQSYEKPEIDYDGLRMRCSEIILFIEHIIAILHPPIRLQIADSEILSPTTRMRMNEPFDPMTLEPLEEGEIYAFYGDHFVGSLQTISEMMERGIRKTTIDSIFAATLNLHVPFSELVWVRW